MYNASPRGGASPHHKQIPAGPILEFTTSIENSKADQWKKRIEALKELVDGIPEGSAYSDVPAWYNTPPLLRHLALPMSELLKDPRSTVVKRTCEYLTELFNRCQVDARYLFKDIMPTILAVHGQTVQVIRQAVQAMIMESIPEVPCKMIMPLWMDRLKVDKSRTVREACAMYLGQALISWTEEGYLTEEIWMQVGTSLIRTLRDPSPDVRANAKAALEKMRNSHPRHWDSLVNDPEGPAAKDVKAQKWLKKLEGGRGTDSDNLSVNSKSSYNSDNRFVKKSLSSPSRLLPPLKTLPPSSSEEPTEDEGGYTVPKSIAVTKARANPERSTFQPMKRAGGLGPPLRRPFAQAVESPDPKASETRTTMSDDDNDNDSHFKKTTLSTDSADGLPPARVQSNPDLESNIQKSLARIQKTLSADSGDASFQSNRNPDSSNLQKAISTDTGDGDLQKAQSTDSRDVLTLPHFPSDLNPTFNRPVPEEISSSHSFDLSEEDGDEAPFVVSIQELKNHASKRRSRNSILMQERFRLSSSNLASSFKAGDEEEEIEIDFTKRRSEEENEVPNAEKDFVIDVNKPPTQAPEHMGIAIRLLRSHKEHVDTIMETLKVEMDTLRDFDKLLEKSGRPTEEEVLDYFEALGLCLDQRSQSGIVLQREMDRISRGEPARK
jgi:hypothetical protein